MNPDRQPLSGYARRLHLALRVTGLVAMAAGIGLLVLGHADGVFPLGFGLVAGCAAALHRCGICGKRVGVVRVFVLQLTMPFAGRCLHCGAPVRAPDA